MTVSIYYVRVKGNIEWVKGRSDGVNLVQIVH